MFKIFYGMPSDLIEKSNGVIGLLDIFQKCKFTIYNEIAQLRGEKIDIAYIPNNEKIIAQLVEIGVKKMSIFSNGLDNVVIPKTYTKVSSEATTCFKNCYNVVLNNKTYVTDVEFVIQGEDDPFTDVARNLYILYGNVITSTWSKHDMVSLKKRIVSSNLPNAGDMYVHVYTTLEGLKQCTLKKYVIRVNAPEFFSGIPQLIECMKTNDKIICNNVGFRKISMCKFGISTGIIAGKYDMVASMYYNSINMLHNRFVDMRKRIRLEFNLSQILALGCLIGKIDFTQSEKDVYVKEIMTKHFYVISLDDLGIFRIPIGKDILTVPVNKDLCDKVCEIKTISEI